jgi:hypothetical protein
MPYNRGWVDPEVVLTHEGVVVYNTYRNDDMSQGIREYWFTTDPLLGELDEGIFDVRMLGSWSMATGGTQSDRITRTLLEAISRGEIGSVSGA